MKNKRWFRSTTAMVLAALIMTAGAAAVTASAADKANLSVSAASYGAQEVVINNFKATPVSGSTLKVNTKLKFTADVQNAYTNYGVWTSANIVIKKNGYEFANLNYNLGNQRQDTWTPTETGRYKAVLSVVDWYGKYAKQTIVFDVVARSGDVDISNFRAYSLYGGNMRVGSTIKFNANVANAYTNYGVWTSANIVITKNGHEFANLDYNLGDQRQDTWTPAEPGDYTAVVSVVDWYGRYAKSTIGFKVDPCPSDVLVDNFRATSTSGVLSAYSPVKFSADVRNAMTNYGVWTSANIVVTKDGKQYANLDYNLGSRKDTWTPTAAGRYTAVLSVIDYYGHCGKSTIDFVVGTGLSFTSSISRSTITLGQSVTAKATGKNGAGSYQYAFSYRKTGASSWTTIKGYNVVNEVSFKPAEAGSYDFRMQVKDANNRVISKTIKITVQSKIVNSSTLSTTSVKLGKTLTATGKATGGSGSYTYSVLYKLTTASTWTTARGYSSTKTATVKLPATGKYNVCVRVKDGNGMVVDKKFTVSVTK